MTKQTTLLAIAATAILIAGCEYEAPLVEEHTIPVDAELLGLWKPMPEKGETMDDDENMMVLRYSDTEYLIYYPANTEGFFFRGYPIKIEGVACVQLEVIGVADGPVGKDEKDLFLVAAYTITNGEMEVRLLNESVVSDNHTTSKELRKAFLENIDNKELFEDDFGRFRRVKRE